MLETLSIHHIVLIQKLHLNFGQGLQVLTGETGAGKSIILDSIALILGQRADSGLIRQGENQASVSATFVLPETHPVFTMLRDLSIEHEAEQPLYLKRTLQRQGSSRCFINDQAVSLSTLKVMGQMVVDIHGQFDHLYSKSYQQAVFDGLLDIEQKKEVAALYEGWCDAVAALANAQNALDQALCQQDYYHRLFDDLSTLQLLEDEEQGLVHRQNTLQLAGRAAQALQDVRQKLTTPTDCLNQLYASLRPLQRLDYPRQDHQLDTNLDLDHGHHHFDPLDRDLRDLITIGDELCDKAQVFIQTLEGLASSMFDQQRALEVVSNRLYQLRKAAKRYNTTVDGLWALWQKAQGYQKLLTQGQDDLDMLNTSALQAKKSFEQKAKNLYTQRAMWGQRLSDHVMKELSGLKLPHATFVVQVQIVPEEKWSRRGIDELDLMVSMNANQALSSLEQTASGGEMSRLLLAIKVVLTKFGDQTCLIFDEIDSGVGGDVATRIGKRLYDLSLHQQVLCITHSPQVAAWAHQHFVVVKDEGRTSVHYLEPPQRLEEIARMLAGSVVTDHARAAAQALTTEINHLRQ